MKIASTFFTCGCLNIKKNFNYLRYLTTVVEVNFNAAFGIDLGLTCTSFFHLHCEHFENCISVLSPVL